MSELSFFNEPWFAYGVLPALIFCSRIADVSLDTLRIIFLNRGRKFIAPMLGFIQVIIWLMAITQVMQNLRNPICYFAYSAGFATGNFIGLLIEEKIAAGMLTLRLITPRAVAGLTEALRKLGHGVTTITGSGVNGSVNVIFVVLRRCHLPAATALIKEHAPDAFYSTEEVRLSSGGTVAAHSFDWRNMPLFRRSRNK